MASSALMWLFMMYWFLQWWGLLGIIAALFLPPLAVLFPFIYWWQESFPITYILIWLTGIVALFAGFALTGSIARRQLRKAYESGGQQRRRSRKYEDAIEGEVVEKE